MGPAVVGAAVGPLVTGKPVEPIVGPLVGPDVGAEVTGEADGLPGDTVGTLVGLAVGSRVRCWSSPTSAYPTCSVGVEVTGAKVSPGRVGAVVTGASVAFVVGGEVMRPIFPSSGTAPAVGPKVLAGVPSVGAGVRLIRSISSCVAAEGLEVVLAVVGPGVLFTNFSSGTAAEGRPVTDPPSLDVGAAVACSAWGASVVGRRVTDPSSTEEGTDVRWMNSSLTELEGGRSTFPPSTKEGTAVR